jgi:hypothetical protein
MKVMINDTIETFWTSLSITGMKSPEPGVLETTIYGKDEDLVKLFHVDEVTCKCDNGMVFKGIIKEFSVTEGVSGAVKVTMQLYRL